MPPPRKNTTMIILVVVGLVIICCSLSISSSMAGGYSYFTKSKKPTSPPPSNKKVDDIFTKLIYNPQTKSYMQSDGDSVWWSRDKNPDQVWSFKKDRIIHANTQKCLNKNLTMLECNYNNDDQKWIVTTKNIKTPDNKCISADNDTYIRIRDCKGEDQNDLYQFFEWPKS